jgi:hypothetical protein
VAANDLRYVSRIDIEDSAGKITPLKRTTLGWLRDFFCQIFSLVVAWSSTVLVSQYRAG